MMRERLVMVDGTITREAKIHVGFTIARTLLEEPPFRAAQIIA
jgi:hypothetical protein